MGKAPAAEGVPKVVAAKASAIVLSNKERRAKN